MTQTIEELKQDADDLIINVLKKIKNPERKREALQIVIAMDLFENGYKKIQNNEQQPA